MVPTDSPLHVTLLHPYSKSQGIPLSVPWLKQTHEMFPDFNNLCQQRCSPSSQRPMTLTGVTVQEVTSACSLTFRSSLVREA